MLSVFAQISCISGTSDATNRFWLTVTGDGNRHPPSSRLGDKALSRQIFDAFGFQTATNRAFPATQS